MAKNEPNGAADDGGVEVQTAELPEATEGAPAGGGGQVEILLETSLPVEVHLGHVQTRVRELLRLGPGAVLRLDKQVGEPVDLYLRSTRFATGHLVVVGDRLGVRIKEIISPKTQAAVLAEDAP